jgi:hypothetical protein
VHPTFVAISDLRTGECGRDDIVGNVGDGRELLEAQAPSGFLGRGREAYGPSSDRELSCAL